jgi:EmrB/QacA subfamily drug resistance transporter
MHSICAKDGLMAAAVPGAEESRSLVLAAMIFAVSMTFIDQTIVSIAAPTIQQKLGLSSTGIQWAVNAYLLALAATFAFGGRLADTFGHAKLAVIGVVMFATSSALCGATPSGSGAEAWIVTFRAIQGVGGALMFPAALAIVVQTFPIHERGRALALFFGIAGGLTAVGPIAGGYLTEWTWRSIFWINVPVAIIALILTAIAKPKTEYRRAPIDYRGLVLIAAGVGLSIFGFQQSSTWGWRNVWVWVAIVAGLALLVVFTRVELRTEHPLMRVRIFSDRAFLMDNIVLGISMLAFIPVFFFASEYAEISLGKKSTQAGIVLLYFFIGFVIAAQIGGRMLDRGGARRPVFLGCVLAAVGFGLWAGKMTDLNFSAQQGYIILAGAGMGLMLGQANTDAVNRASRFSYGEATGITQTVRNYAASLGFAILGTVLLSQLRSHLTSTLMASGLSHKAATAEAASIAQLQDQKGGVAAIPQFVRIDFAHATQAVFYVMCGVMVVAALVARAGLEPGRQTEVVASEAVALD